MEISLDFFYNVCQPSYFHAGAEVEVTHASVRKGPKSQIGGSWWKLLVSENVLKSKMSHVQDELI